MHRQTTGKIVMIKPMGFYSNKETAINNFYQHTETEDRATIQRKAKEEFENLAEKLFKAGIEVNIIEDTAEPSTPDSIFPNNWFSSHEKGKFFFYPMFKYQYNRLQQQSRKRNFFRRNREYYF